MHELLKEKAVVCGREIGEKMTVRDFPCQIHHNVISEALLEKWGHLLPAAYTSAEPMVLLAAAMADSIDSPLLALPLDCMAEAEALGARITGYHDCYGLRAQGHILKNVEELSEISFNGLAEKGRIRQILDAIALAASMGYTPCLNLSGFLTTADLLVSMEKVILAWRKKKESLDVFFQRYAGLLAEYAYLAQQNGAKIISYSDPLAACDIIGPRWAAEIGRDMVVPLMGRLLELPGGGVIHLCGKTSYALEAAQTIKLEEVPLKVPTAYQKAVVALARRGMEKQDKVEKLEKVERKDKADEVEKVDKIEKTEKIILGHGCLNHNQITDRLWRLNLLDKKQ